MRRWFAWLIVIAAVLFGGMKLRDHARKHPEDLPWTPLDLRQPIGAFTSRKIAALADDATQCRVLLAAASVKFMRLPAREEGTTCGYLEAERLDGADQSITYHPPGLSVSCPVAAGLAVWERQVVEQAAARHFRSEVTSIDHFGSYSCRRLYGRSQGVWSEHAHANAVDIAGFRLADGRRISVERDWPRTGPESAFLHEVRDGACRLFATVLSPSYNRAHYNHLHLDQAQRGQGGWTACR
ncbi:hypothetical protein ACUXST_001705 [Sphingomonas sp. F9_3S_D5_B_2]